MKNGQGTRTVTPSGFEFPVSTASFRFHFPRGQRKATVYRGTWIAENAEEIKPNYTIDSAEIKPAATETVVFFSLSKPKTDWPRGLYRLEIRADGTLVHTEHFVVR